MNKQGPLKAILDKGGLKHITVGCVPTLKSIITLSQFVSFLPLI